MPYLFVDNSSRERWREKVGSVKGLKVGITWQGNPKYGGDRHRSIRLEQFRPLAEIPNVHLFSLQKGTGSEQLPEFGQAFPITDLGSLISADFRDTAAAMVNLDLVISVDTSVAHLAGALGVPLWVLLPFNPDWRWLLDRDDSLWYPSARLFRQQTWGDWEGVFTRVASALRLRARRPLPHRMPVALSLLEMVERAVLAELNHANAEETWQALRQAEVPDNAEFRGLVAGLKSAHEVLEGVGKQMDQMEQMEPGQSDTQAVELIQRYARGRQERAEALSRFSAWLGGMDSAACG
jgi:hypothetical protein